MDEEGMPPLSVSDLDPMHGRLIYNFFGLILECREVLRKWVRSDFTGLQSTSTKEDFGFYFKAFDFGCYLSFSTHKWFSRNIQTPIWLYIQSVGSKSWEKSEKIHHFLNIFDSKNSYDQSNNTAYGIMLKTGMDKVQIVNHIVNKTKEVLNFLNDKMPMNPLESTDSHI